MDLGAHDTEDFVNELRAMDVTPHEAWNTNRRRTRHAGYGVRLRIRERIKKAFGWIKTVTGQG